MVICPTCYTNNIYTCQDKNALAYLFLLWVTKVLKCCYQKNEFFILGQNLYVRDSLGFYQIQSFKNSDNRVLITEDFENILDCEQEVKSLKLG